MPTKAKKPPSSLGVRIDRLYKHRQKRLDLQRAVEDLDKAEKEMIQDLVVDLRQADLKSSSGSLATFSWYLEAFALVKDEDAFRKAVVEKDLWHMVSLRPRNATFREVWDQEPEHEIPGVTREHNVKTSLVKAGRKKA